jgi:hypothetical protein
LIKGKLNPQMEPGYPTYYANFFRVKLNPHDVVLEFGRMDPPVVDARPEELIDVPVRMEGQIYVTPEIMRELRDLLTRQLAQRAKIQITEDEEAEEE